MPEQWIKIGGVPTRVLSYGKSIKEETFERKELVLCISGNPGLSGFYTVFLSTLFRLLIDIPVWGIGAFKNLLFSNFQRKNIQEVLKVIDLMNSYSRACRP